MRLLDTSTLQVEEFLQDQAPEYAILSHTWREEEITLNDLHTGAALSKKGFAKLTGCCKKAKEDGFAYCWIDTCCIDKTSSAELSEAINSMYQWYKGACVCYVHLEDVLEDPQLDDYEAFNSSRWFTRGWTLQELIAPQVVEFYTASWVEIGTRRSLGERITNITGIHHDMLMRGEPSWFSVAVRMFWASRRETTREEDKAYCLLGIFGVNMPLLYGEGEGAFLRLQEEILRTNEDYTLFAWDVQSLNGSALASSARQFRTFTPRLDRLIRKNEPYKTIHDYPREALSRTCFTHLDPPHDHSPPRLTSRGVHLTLPLLLHEGTRWYGALTLLELPQRKTYVLCVELLKITEHGNRYEKAWDRKKSSLVLLPGHILQQFRYTSIYINPYEGNLKDIYPPDNTNYSPPIVRVSLDPALLPDIACIASTMFNIRAFGTERLGLRLPKAKTLTRTIVPSDPYNYPGLGKDWAISNCSRIAGHLPDLCYVPIYYPYDVLRFQLGPRASVDLEVLLSLNSVPCFFARIVPKTDPDVDSMDNLDYRRGKWIDRASFHMAHATDGVEQESHIRVTLRPAGKMAVAPNSKHYVLRFTIEHVVKRVITA